MSGEKLLPRSRKPEPGPLEKSFGIEDDRRLARFTGAGSIFGACFAAYALTFTFPPGFCRECDNQPPPPPPRRDVPFTIKPPADYHGKIHPPKYAKHTPKPGQPGRPGAKPQVARPAERTGTVGQNLITSRSGKNNLGAYDLVPKAIRDLDLDKLSDMGVLRRTAHSEDIGGRRGKQSHEFNLEYYEDGTGDGGGEIVMPGGPTGQIPTRVRRPEAIGGTKSIEMVQGDNARSTASILAVIRSRSPGLRHIYNAFLKQNPGFAGKINLRFEIAPGGDVVAVDIASSTTHVRDFDAEILRQVKSWRFDPVKAIGNDHVTVPFTFSE